MASRRLIISPNGSQRVMATVVTSFLWSPGRGAMAAPRSASTSLPPARYSATCSATAPMASLQRLCHSQDGPGSARVSKEALRYRAPGPWHVFCPPAGRSCRSTGTAPEDAADGELVHARTDRWHRGRPPLHVAVRVRLGRLVLADGFFPANYPGWDDSTYWLLGVVCALALFASVLAHELSHSLAALSQGQQV